MELEEARKEMDLGRGNRARKDVAYQEQISEREWLKVEDKTHSIHYTDTCIQLLFILRNYKRYIHYTLYHKQYILLKKCKRRLKGVNYFLFPSFSYMFSQSKVY